MLFAFLLVPNFANAQAIVRPAFPTGHSESGKTPKKKVIPIKTFRKLQDSATVPGAVEVDQEASQDDLSTENEAVNQSPISFGPWNQKSIRDIRIDIRDPNPVVPRDRSNQLTLSNVSDWSAFYPSQKVFAWKAPNIKYQPLYFEDVSLERYGQDRGDVRQFAASSFHFFKSAVFLPYAMVVDQPKSCDYPLGFCRPGNVAPATLSKHWYGLPRRR